MGRTNFGGATRQVVAATRRAVMETVEKRFLLVGTGSGLLAQYFDNSDFTTLKVTRQDATVDFNWGTGSPDATVGADTFSARWTGQVLPQYTQTYTFRVDADDGAKLWVNNVAIIANYTTSGTGTIALTAGQKYDIRMEMQESTGNATAKLQWSSSSQPLQVIPASRLYRQSATQYYTNLEASLASTYGLPANPVNLIGDNEDIVAETKPRSVTQVSPNPFTLSAIDADYGNPGGFLRASRSTNNNTSRDSWMDQYIISGTNTAGSFAVNDRMLASFWIRGSNFESGTKGYVKAVIYQGSTVFASRHIEVDGTWRQYFLRGQASAAPSTTGSTFGLQFLVGYQTQTIDVGGAAILNYGAGSISQLPATTPISYDYEGRRVNGTGSPQWYVDAQARIEQHRKANLNVTVRNSAGALVNGATVQFKMRQHEFEWGSQALAYDLYTRSDRAQTRRTLEDMYRDGTNKRLNAMVLGDLKWDYELIPETMSALQWYRDLGMHSSIGHTLMWGDRSSIPAGQDNLTAIRSHITALAQRYAGALEGWDVLNETYGRRVWEDQLGYAGFVSEVKTWFDLAKAPDVNNKLWLNDNNILSGGGLDQNRIDYYIKLINDLKAAGAPVYGLGAQSHFGNDGQRQFTPPDQVYRNLEEITSATGVKMRVSEFDMYNGASDAYDADYMRDFMTVVFSHNDVDGFYSWGMGDSNHWQNDGPWYDANWNLKPAGQAFLDTIFNTWWTDSTTSTNASGVASVRGFKGSYDIVVTSGGVTTVFPANLTGDQSLNLTLPSTTVPSAPVNLNARRSSATETHLTWDHVSTIETGYSIERSTNGTTFTVVGTTAANVLSFKDTGLTSDTRYFYRVRATGSGGSSGYSNVDDARTNVAGTNTVSGNLYNDANGNAVKDAGETNLVGWTVYFDENLNNKFDPWEYSRLTDANGNYSLPQILYGNFMVGQDLQPGWTRTTSTLIHTGSVTNNQTITGRNFGNRFTGTTIPAAPTSLTASAASATQINVTWVDNANNETGFELDYSTSSTFASGVTTVNLGANITGASVTGLAASTTYYFRVRSTNSAGDSANSSTANATTQAGATVPAAPSGVAAAVASSSQINVTWTDNSTNETGFEVDYSTSSTFASGVTTLTTGSNVTSRSVTGLAASTTYYFRVRATNATGDSANSNTANATTQAASGLPAPWVRTDVGTPTTPGTASVASGVWTLTNSGVDTSTANNLNFAYVTLTGDGSITARVASVSTNEPYARGGVMMRETLTAGSKYASAAMYATMGSIANWRSTTGGAWGNSNSGGVTTAPPRWVRVVRAGNTFTMQQSANGTTWGTIGVAQTITMASTIYIGLINSANNAAETNTSTFDNVSYGGSVSLVDGIPSAPTALSVGQRSSSSIELLWNDNSSTELGFEVDVASDINFQSNTYTVTAPADASGMVVNGLSSNTQYFFRIRAVGPNGNSDNSPPTSASTVGAEPAAPSDLAMATATSNRIDLTWLDNSDSELGFILERSTSSSFESVVAVPLAANTTSYSVTGLSASTTYYFRIRATGLAGESTNSVVLTAQTPARVGGDANEDGRVDFSDLLILAQNYTQSGRSWAEGDFTGDASVDFSDLLVLAQNYGSGVNLLSVSGINSGSQQNTQNSRPREASWNRTMNDAGSTGQKEELRRKR
jgi:PA14 domain/Glycosyl hydrolase family 10/Fibronectin type III domain